MRASGRRGPSALRARVAGRLWRDETSDVGRFGRQLVVLSGVVATLVAIALVVIVQVVLVGAASQSVGRVLQERADAVVSATRQAPGGGLDVPDARLDPGVAVYDDAGDLVAGEIPPSLSEAFSRLSRAGAVRTGRADDDYELMARPFGAADGTRGVVVVAEPLQPYENDEGAALVVSVVAGAVIVALAMIVTAWASRRALAPVGEMARVAEEWSDRDLHRRFDLGEPTNEIRALGHTLDGLLDRVAQAILAEQRLTSELAHELRSPLTAIQATAELVAMREDLDDQLREDLADIQDSCRAMSATVTGLIDLARAQVSGAASDVCDLEAVLESIRQGLATQQGPPTAAAAAISVEVARPIRVAAPAELVRRAVSPVVDNAVRLATQVRVTARIEGRLVHLQVSDDGPGIPPRLVSHLFEPGRTGGDGTGLGLALARRVARSVGGDIALADATAAPGAGPRGSAFVITLPVA